MRTRVSTVARSKNPRRARASRFVTGAARWWNALLIPLMGWWSHGLLNGVVAAETPQPYIARSWLVEDGLPHNYVLAVAQTRDGYLWVGTRGGLARFDGLQFTPIAPAGLEGMGVSCLCEGADGSLWVGLETNGVVRLKGQSFWHYSLTNASGRNYTRVLCAGRDGAVWIGTRGGLVQYADGTFRDIPLADGLVVPVVETLCEDPAGRIWAGTTVGLCCVSNGVVTATFTARNGLPADLVASVFADGHDSLWVGTSAGLVRFRDGMFHTVYTEANGLADRFIQVLHEDRKGHLWIGTYGGLYRTVNEPPPGTEPGPATQCVPQWTAQGEAYDRVMSVVEDHEGSLWVGSRDGLTRLQIQRITRFGKEQGLSQNSVTAVCADAAGTLWVASWRGGLDRLLGDTVTAFASARGLQTDMLLSLEAGPAGDLWIGTDHAGGLYHLKDGILTHYDARHGLTNVAIFALCEDRSGALWIGTARTLTRFSDGKFTDFTEQDGLVGDPVRVILEDHAGDLWVGTGQGLSRRTHGRFVNYTTREGLSDNAVTALYEDTERNLWIGTAAGGLNRFRRDRFVAYTARDGLFSNDVLEILEDNADRLWISCREGVYCVERNSLDDFDAGRISAITCVSFGKDEGLTGVQCTSAAKPAGCKDRRGRLWFTTSKGLIVVAPEFRKNTTPPRVVLERIIADEQQLWPPSWRPGTGEPTAATSAAAPVIRVPPGRGELEFRYTALSYQSPEKNRFQYRLEGMDDDWVNAGARRTAYYGRVPPGQYRFRVRGCNNHGVWNEAGAGMAVVIQPHLWQTWWFYALVLTVSAGLMGGSAIHLARRAAQRRLARVEQQHALEQERSRIARDIHDDLGSSLTRIAMLSELAEADKAEPAKVETHVRRIAISARETMRSLDEIVWAVSPQNDTWNSLVGYLSEYAREFFEGTSVRCRLEMPLDLPAGLLPSEMRHSLFLIIKEAFSNSLKHARASEVRVRLTVQNGQVIIQITDNGCGFDLNRAEIDSRGNGLRNMRERVASLDGQLHIHSDPGQGTKLTLYVGLDARSSVLFHEPQPEA